MSRDTQYLTNESLQKLQDEMKIIKDIKIPEIAKRIDDAKQLGDLSENAEYHQAKDDMAWAQSRLLEIQFILDNSEMIDEKEGGKKDKVILGSLVTLEVNGKKKEYRIVGQQEADPLNGKISNESPLGRALLGASIKDKVKIKTPSGEQFYVVLKIS